MLEKDFPNSIRFSFRKEEKIPEVLSQKAVKDIFKCT